MVNKKLAWTLIIIASAGAAGLVFYYNQRFYRDYISESRELTNLTQLKPPAADLAWVEIDFGDRKRLFEGTIGKNSYGLASALQSVAQAGNFNLLIKYGKISEVAGVKNNSKKWKIYKNNELQAASLDKLIINAGDRYALRFE